MTIEPPAGDDPPIFHAVTSRRRRRSGAPAAVVAVVAVGALAAGATGVWLWRTPGAASGVKAVEAASPAKAGQAASSRRWVLPEGTPSMGDAEACLRDRRLPCAEADLLAYLKLYPSDAHANALLAITLTQDGRHKEALYYYRKADSLGVDTYDFDAGYAKSLDATGDLDGAIQRNQAALKIVPRLVDVRGSLADELVRKGRAKEAVALLASFDRKLEAEGYSPYFTEQINHIKKGMGGEYAKEAAAADAPLKPDQPGQTLVRGEPEAGTLVVPVSIDGAPTMSFTVDSGASMVSIPWDDAEPFIKTGLIGRGDYQGEAPFQLANGAKVTASLYRLKSVRVGDREVKDVLAAVYRGHGPRLLGQSFLKRFKSWSIDNDRRALVLEN